MKAVNILTLILVLAIVAALAFWIFKPKKAKPVLDPLGKGIEPVHNADGTINIPGGAQNVAADPVVRSIMVTDLHSGKKVSISRY